jgi:hypothetical protein
MAQVNDAFLSSISAATSRCEERVDERAATAAAFAEWPDVLPFAEGFGR